MFLFYVILILYVYRCLITALSEYYNGIISQNLFLYKFIIMSAVGVIASCEIFNTNIGFIEWYLTFCIPLDVLFITDLLDDENVKMIQS